MLHLLHKSILCWMNYITKEKKPVIMSLVDRYAGNYIPKVLGSNLVLILPDLRDEKYFNVENSIGDVSSQQPGELIFDTLRYRSYKSNKGS